MPRRIVVTGAYSYTGAAVARELIQRGHTVHTLTNRRPPPGNTISSAPLRFEPDHLKRQLEGADALINTYWVRLPFQGEDFTTAVRNSRTLIDAAAGSDIGRIVHVSVSNASAGMNLGYYAGKAQVEETVRQCGRPYSIVCPTLITGPSDVLTNNIAWLLRRFPLFLMPGGGGYRLQPITLSDTARIIADEVTGLKYREVDAAGPEVLTFDEYVRRVADACGVRRRIVHAPESLTLTLLRTAGWALRDIILTREELLGLQQELLVSHSPPLGRESVVAWLQAHGKELGRRYVNDLQRHFGNRRTEPIP